MTTARRGARGWLAPVACLLVVTALFAPVATPVRADEDPGVVSTGNDTDDAGGDDASIVEDLANASVDVSASGDDVTVDASRSTSVADGTVETSVGVSDETNATVDASTSVADGTGNETVASVEASAATTAEPTNASAELSAEAAGRTDHATTPAGDAGGETATPSDGSEVTVGSDASVAVDDPSVAAGVEASGPDASVGTGANASGSDATVDVGANASAADGTVTAGANATAPANAVEAGVNASAADGSLGTGIDATVDDVGIEAGVDATLADVTVEAAVVPGAVDGGAATDRDRRPDSSVDRAGSETTRAALVNGGPAAPPSPSDHGASAARAISTPMPDPGGGGDGPFGPTGSTAAGVAVAGVAAGAALRSGQVAGSTGPAPFRAGATWVRTAIDAVPRAVVPFGYSRWHDADPLEHELRVTLRDAVEADPGVYLTALADRTDASLSAVRHHLDVLEEADLVASRRLYGRRCYFPADEDEPAVAAALETEAKARIVEALDALGPASGSELAAHLDRDQSTVSHHLSALAEAGVVERERDGRTVTTRLAPAARRVVGGRPAGGEVTPADD